VVNAWAIYDRSTDVPLGDYTENTNPLPGGHRLNYLVQQAALHQLVDFVFAAGNCGAFCPSPRCGPVDRGPDRSIWGANSLDAVITVGAVATNDMWLGYSSQGQGQELLGRYKPDLCAPSQFVETIDAHVQNTGTSAACGLTAGVTAALRRRWNQSQLPPQALKAILTSKARKTQGTPWNRRTGYGVLDAKSVLDALLP
jgi:subtilisin family serine protease